MFINHRGCARGGLKTFRLFIFITVFYLTENLDTMLQTHTLILTPLLDSENRKRPPVSFACYVLQIHW